MESITESSDKKERTEIKSTTKTSDRAYYFKLFRAASTWALAVMGSIAVIGGFTDNPAEDRGASVIFGLLMMAPVIYRIGKRINERGVSLSALFNAPAELIDLPEFREMATSIGLKVWGLAILATLTLWFWMKTKDNSISDTPFAYLTVTDLWNAVYAMAGCALFAIWFFRSLVNWSKQNELCDAYKEATKRKTAKPEVYFAAIFGTVEYGIFFVIIGWLIYHFFLS